VNWWGPIFLVIVYAAPVFCSYGCVELFFYSLYKIVELLEFLCGRFFVCWLGGSIVELINDTFQLLYAFLHPLDLCFQRLYCVGKFLVCLGGNCWPGGPLGSGILRFLLLLCFSYLVTKVLHQLLQVFDLFLLLLVIYCLVQYVLLKLGNIIIPFLYPCHHLLILFLLCQSYKYRFLLHLPNLLFQFISCSLYNVYGVLCSLFPRFVLPLYCQYTGYECCLVP
jgi:hypothetical protein